MLSLQEVRRIIKTASWVGSVLLARALALLVHPASACPRMQFLGTWRNLTIWLRHRADPDTRACLQRYFDVPSYLANDSHVEARTGSPFVHYLLYGFSEGRNPSGDFDGPRYLSVYPDVSKAGLNPLLHYAVFGRRENRSVMPCAGLEPIAVRQEPEEVIPLCIRNEWLPDRPLVSVVITCFNYGRYIRQALDSVLAQTFGSVEIIVVEGGSTDGTTPQVVRRIEQEGLPGVRFVYREEPCLAGDNRNAGISAANGRYICCLDADDTLLPTYLEVAAFLAEAYGYDIVYPSVYSFGGSDITWLVTDASFPAILSENQVSTVALFRRSAWSHIGGYRDWISVSEHVPEDWDFWVRLLGHGFLAKSIRAPLLRYRVHERSLSAGCRIGNSYQSTEISAANRHLLDLPASPKKRVQVLDPWVNLYRSAPESNGSAVWFALPYATTGGADTLFATLVKGLLPDYTPVVTTSVPLPPSMPANFEPLEKLTPHVYDLPALFEDPARWKDFLWYLLHTKNIRLIFLAGSEFIYHLLPEIRTEFPDVRVIDQLFNDSGHVVNNRRYAEYIDLTIVPSDELAVSLVRDHAAVDSRIMVIPHGIDVNPAGNPCQDNLPAKAPGQFVVSYFGRLSPEKGPEVFVEIAERLKSNQDMFFYMTGEGPEKPAVLDLISRYRLAERIYTPGFVAEVRPLMENSDVVVLPSWLDGMPLVVLEAQALGKPVVASRVGSLPAMVVDGETGFLCDSGDIDAFCRSITKLWREPGLGKAMGEKGRIRIAEMFGAERMVSRYRTAMQLLLAAGVDLPAQPPHGQGSDKTPLSVNV